MKKVALAIHAKKDFDPNVIQGLENLDYIHVDVMDGKFVDNINNNLGVFKILKKKTKIPIVAHLMVNNPSIYIKKIIKYIDIFLFHFEIEEDKFQILKKLKNYNKKIGLVINPETEISEIIPYLQYINNVLVMSVHPGWSGQKFIPEIIQKVNNLAELKKQFQFEIMVDGGVNLENANKLDKADILSSSSTILNAEDPNSLILILKGM